MSGKKPAAPDNTRGRKKIEISYIRDRNRRHITFSKRKAGIMKKAYELSTLTGTQVLLLVASETGHVYSYATKKLQTLITEQQGKDLIQECLKADDDDEDVDDRAEGASEEDLPDDADGADYSEDDASES